MAGSKKPFPKGLMIFLCIFLGIVLVALIGVTIFANSFFGKINRFDKEQETLSDEQIESILNETDPTEEGFEGEILNEDDVLLPEGDAERIEKNENLVHIMLIGQDRRPNQGRTRSDAMILCTINKENKTLVMTSFMRDTYVKIPDVNGKRYGKNRLNVPYILGGMESLAECMVMNFGIEVDHFIEVDFSQFEQIVDEIGGVDIELTKKEANKLELQVGMNHLDGVKALEYARLRKIDNDFGRTNRQRTVLLAILDKVMGMSVNEILSLTDTIFPMITTDMTNADIVGYVIDFFPLLKDLKITTQGAPMEGEYKGAMINGMAVLVPDMEKLNARLKETIGS